jgi:gas vesicle protein
MEANDNGGSNFVKGFLVGGFIGAALGMLFAPKPGRDFRDNIRDESEELYDKAKEELTKLKEELDTLRQKISETLDKGKAAFKDDDLAQEERDFEEQINAADEEKPQEEKTEKKTRAKRSTKS